MIYYFAYFELDWVYVNILPKMMDSDIIYPKYF